MRALSPRALFHAALCAAMLAGAFSIQAADAITDAGALDGQVKELLYASKYKEALPLAQRAVELRRAAVPANSAALAHSLNNLGRLQTRLGRYAEAAPILEEARQIGEKDLGEDSPVFGESLQAVAERFYAIGDLEKTDELTSQALRIREKARGRNHEDFAESLSLAATICMARGDSANAEPLCLEALKCAGPPRRTTALWILTV